MGCDYNIDEVFLTINGQRHYLWRAVDQDDNVLDILVQSRRNKHAAKKFFRKLLKGLSPSLTVARYMILKLFISTCYRFYPMYLGCLFCLFVYVEFFRICL